MNTENDIFKDVFNGVETMSEKENESEENFEVSNEYMVYPEYIDQENVVVISDSKRVGNFDNQVSVQGESDSQYVVFEMNRYCNGIDLSQKMIQVHYERPDGEGDNSPPVNVMVSDSRIRFGWIVPVKATEINGKLKVMPFVYGESPVTGSDIYLMKTLYVEYIINNGLSIDGGLKKNDEWYSQFLIQMMNYVKTAQDSANEAKESGESSSQIYLHIVDLIDQISDIDYTVTEIVQYRDDARLSEGKAKQYMEEARNIASSVGQGGILPFGTIAFENLPEEPTLGAMYNISNNFVTDDRFVEGSGYNYKAGTNIYYTTQELWDVFSGVEYTKDDLGLGKVENKNSEEIRDEITKENVENALGYTPLSDEDAVIIDDELNQSSENPVQNKVITAKVEEIVSQISEDWETQKSYIDGKINDLINGAPEALDTLKEIADAISDNADVVSALNSAIGNKVDKVTGKGLSTNDFTTDLLNKLNGLSEDAEKNVQVDWNVSDVNSDAYIKNKPSIFSGNYNDLAGKPSIPSFIKTTATITASGWTGTEAPFAYGITVSGVTSTSDIEIGLVSSSTVEQVDAFAKALIIGGSQSTNYFQLLSFGEKPEVNISINISVRNGG